MYRPNIQIFTIFLFLITSFPSLSLTFAAGYKHTVLLDEEGNVWSFGDNRFGQLGHGDDTSKLTPTKIQRGDLHHIIAIKAGDSHSMLLDAEGNVWTFGNGSYGRLGHGDEANKLVPTKIQRENLPNIITIEAGNHHTVLLDEQGNVWTFGNGCDGRLGHGDEASKLVPTKIQREGIPNIIAIKAGKHHTMLLDEQGNVWTFGYGSYGRLGHGDEANKLVPTKIQREDLPNIIAIEAGNHHTMLLDEQGNVWTFGYGCDGRLGHGDKATKWVPTKIQREDLPNIIAIEAGNSHSMLLDEQGNVWTFGYGRKLGHGDKATKLVPTKIQREDLPNIIAIEAGNHHTILLDEQGNVWTFGYGQDGRLGHGDEETKSVPTLVKGLPPIKIPPRKQPIKSSLSMQF